MVLIAAGASLVGVLSAGWTPVLGVQLQGGVEVVLRPADEVSDEQFERAIEIIRNRVDAIGVAEPDITRQGSQVVIQLPGVKDKQRAVDLIGQTAELTFRPVQSMFDPLDPNQLAAVGGSPSGGGQLCDRTGHNRFAPLGTFDRGETECEAPEIFGSGVFRFAILLNRPQ